MLFLVMSMMIPAVPALAAGECSSTVVQRNTITDEASIRSLNNNMGFVQVWAWAQNVQIEVPDAKVRDQSTWDYPNHPTSVTIKLSHRFDTSKPGAVIIAAFDECGDVTVAGFGVEYGFDEFKTVLDLPHPSIPALRLGRQQDRHPDDYMETPCVDADVRQEIMYLSPSSAKITFSIPDNKILDLNITHRGENLVVRENHPTASSAGNTTWEMIISGSGPGEARADYLIETFCKDHHGVINIVF